MHSVTPPTGDEPADVVLDVEALGQRAVRQLVVRAIVVRAITLIGTIALARLLTPAEFGAFAVVTLIVAFIALVGDFGTSAAIIQQDHDPTDLELSTAFVTQVGVWSLLATVIWVVAGAIPSVRADLPPDVTAAARVLAVTLFIGGLRAIPTVMLSRVLRFGPLAVVEIGQQIVYFGSAVALAAAGFGIMELRPRRICPGPVRDGRHQPRLGALAGRPLRLAGSPGGCGDLGSDTRLGQALAWGREAVVPALGGLAGGLSAIGYLGFAWRNGQLVSAVDQIVQRVAFPAFSRLQREPDRQAALTRTSIELVSVAVATIQGWILISAPVLVPIVFTDRWSPAVVPLQIVCLGSRGDGPDLRPACPGLRPRRCPAGPAAVGCRVGPAGGRLRRAGGPRGTRGCRAGVRAGRVRLIGHVHLGDARHRRVPVDGGRPDPRGRGGRIGRRRARRHGRPIDRGPAHLRSGLPGHRGRAGFPDRPATRDPARPAAARPAPKRRPAAGASRHEVAETELVEQVAPTRVEDRDVEAERLLPRDQRVEWGRLEALDGGREARGVAASNRIPVRPSRTVSRAPPAANATTGRPAAIASTGTIPKSSVPGATSARQRRSRSVRRARSMCPTNLVRGPAMPFECLPLGAVAHDHELPVEPGERADREVDPFVRQEPRRHQVEVVVIGCERDAGHVDRRMDDPAVTPPCPLDPAPGVLRVDDHDVGPPAGPSIPAPQARRGEVEPGLRDPRKARMGKVGVDVPGEAHRGVDVCDVQRRRASRGCRGRRSRNC